LIPLLFFFGICFLGIGDCEDTPTFQEEIIEVINLAYECGQANGTINWTEEGMLGGTLQCELTLLDYTYDGIVPIFTKSYNFLDHTITYDDNGCYYVQSNKTWVLDHCELDRYGYPAEWERNYDNCLKFDDYPDCPEELIEQRLQIKVTNK